VISFQNPVPDDFDKGQPTAYGQAKLYAAMLEAEGGFTNIEVHPNKGEVWAHKNGRTVVARFESSTIPE
jgi:hypothetical protein